MSLDTPFIHLPSAYQFLTPKIFDLDTLADDLYQHGYACVKNILNDTLLQGLLDTLNALKTHNNLTQAHIGRGHNRILKQQIRTNKIHWINGDNVYEHNFLAFLDTVRIELNRRLILGLFDHESHYAVYKQGDFYHRHLDSFKGQKNRIISLVIYLNKNWHSDNGGLLKLYRNPQAQTPLGTVIPEYNHGVFFLSEEIPHEVTVSLKDRLSIACWFRCKNP
jgi:SM-20-related protein